MSTAHKNCDTYKYAHWLTAQYRAKELCSREYILRPRKQEKQNISLAHYISDLGHGGKQTVRVERVAVESSRQAIVGGVSHRGRVKH